ncbi:MAG: sugar transferase, partial [Gemmobacter sp.]
MIFMPALHAAPARRRIVFRVPAWKRPLDLVLAGLAMLALWPLFLAIAAIVRLGTPGPAFFVQERVGLGGQRFGMIKFRSMHQDAEVRRAALLSGSDRAGVCFKMKDDPRVTPFGRFLRRSSLDEL